MVRPEPDLLALAQDGLNVLDKGRAILWHLLKYGSGHYQILTFKPEISTGQNQREGLPIQSFLWGNGRTLLLLDF